MKVNIFTILFFILLCFCSCGKHVNQINIGHEVEKSFFLNNNLDSIKENWKEILKQKMINSNLSRFEIKKGIDKVNNKTYYYLIGRSADDSVKGATQLYNRNKKIFISKDDMIVFCYGCEATYPSFEYNKWGWSCESQTLSTNCKKISIIKF